MSRQAVFVVVAVFALAPSVSSVPSGPGGPSGQDPEVFYEENCASCHTIGGGMLGGPDLKGVTERRDREWLIQFMLTPEKFANDPAVKKMIAESDGMEMGATDGLTRELAEDLLALIDRRSGIAGPRKETRHATDADIAFGRALFTGEARLAGAGAPCVACHVADVPLQGGRLGLDLTNTQARLGGHVGATKWLASPPTPMMKALYRRAPLTPDESHALAAFLTAPITATRVASPVPSFVLPAAGGTLAVLGLIGLVWRGRFRAVRRPLVEQARRLRDGGPK